MELVVNNHKQTFISLQTFRANWNLPESFSLTYFEPKNWEGLASIDGSGPALISIREQTLLAIPERVKLTQLTTIADELTNTFRIQLTAANAQIGLRPPEFDFAVSGFYDVIHAVAFNLIQLALDCRHNLIQVREQFNFSQVYSTWLNDSVGVFSTAHTFEHGDIRFEVRVVYHAYGRVGLEVKTADQVYYVADMALSCPAAGYMHDLCADVAQTLCQALTD